MLVAEAERRPDDVVVPLVLHDFRVFLPVSWQGEPCMAFVDTGARRSSVLIGHAHGLAPAGRAEVLGLFGEDDRALVEAPGLAVGGRDLGPLVADVQEFDGFAGVPLDVRLHLGCDVLGALGAIFDFDLAALRLRAEASLSAVRVPDALPLVAASVDGEATTVVLDTGAGVCVVDLQRPELLEGAIPLADVATDDAAGTGQTLTLMRAAGVWRWPGAARGTTILAVPAPLADLAARAGTAVAAVIGAEALLRAGGCLTWRHAEDGEEGTGR